MEHLQAALALGRRLSREHLEGDHAERIKISACPARAFNRLRREIFEGTHHGAGGGDPRGVKRPRQPEIMHTLQSTRSRLGDLCKHDSLVELIDGQDEMVEEIGSSDFGSLTGPNGVFLRSSGNSIDTDGGLRLDILDDKPIPFRLRFFQLRGQLVVGGSACDDLSLIARHVAPAIPPLQLCVIELSHVTPSAGLYREQASRPRDHEDISAIRHCLKS
jgi:hypothetical protein